MPAPIKSVRWMVPNTTTSSLWNHCCSFSALACTKQHASLEILLTVSTNTFWCGILQFKNHCQYSTTVALSLPLQNPYQHIPPSERKIHFT
jgi:hypothetical protein